MNRHKLLSLIAFLAGCNLPFAFAPFHLYPIAFVAIIALLYTWMDATPHPGILAWIFIWRRVIWRRRILGLCQHPPIWQHATLVSRLHHLPFCTASSTISRDTSLSLRKNFAPYPLQSHSVSNTLPHTLGAVWRSEKLRPVRISLALPRLHTITFCTQRLRTFAGCLWALVFCQLNLWRYTFTFPTKEKKRHTLLFTHTRHLPNRQHTHTYSLDSIDQNTYPSHPSTR